MSEHRYSGVIVRDIHGRLLMVYHTKKKEFPWRIPGGKLEAGEQPIVSAAREALEEIGIAAHSLWLHSVFTQNIDGNDWEGFYFVCDRYSGVPTIQEPEKQGEIRYMTSAEMPPALTSASTIALAQDLERNATPPASW